MSSITDYAIGYAVGTAVGAAVVPVGKKMGCIKRLRGAAAIENIFNEVVAIGAGGPIGFSAVALYNNNAYGLLAGITVVPFIAPIALGILFCAM